jgi:phenylacetate-coenzyme A ligase PaaK-like adenylate-forming protein
MHSTRPLTQFATEMRDWIRRALEPGAPPLPFGDLALRLFALQFEHNPPYRRWCEARNATPAGVTDWRQIPAVPAASFKELELTCLPADERAAEFHSSGTTATARSRHLHSHESLALYESSLTTWFQPHLLPDWRTSHDFAHFVALSPSPALAPYSSLVHMFATVQREFGYGPAQFFSGLDAGGAWTLDFTVVTAARLDQAITRNEPVILLGTAFSFVHLLDALAESGTTLTLPAGSRAMETGGYKGRSRELPKADLHRAITARLGIPATHIVCEYGMSELSSQAYAAGSTTSHSSLLTPYFHFPAWARALVISPETGREVRDGESGLLRVLDLANVWSVMAIQTEDLATRRGHGFELLGRAAAAEPRGCSLMATA